MVVNALKLGMNISDIKEMEIGEISDILITYTNLVGIEDVSDVAKDSDGYIERPGTQQDIQNIFG